MKTILCPPLNGGPWRKSPIIEGNIGVFQGKETPNTKGVCYKIRWWQRHSFEVQKQEKRRNDSDEEKGIVDKGIFRELVSKPRFLKRQVQKMKIREWIQKCGKVIRTTLNSRLSSS